jgi:hypothetical protein
VGTIDSACQFNKIFVIESLPSTDLQTAGRLVRDYLEPVIASLELGLMHAKVTSRSEFLAAMKEVASQCARVTPETYPIVHIEAHGAPDRSGISLFPSGEIISWSEFANLCRVINIACHNNLLVVTALCFGLLSITGVKIAEVSPFFAVVGPQLAVTAGEIEHFNAFYVELFKHGDVVVAMSGLSEKFGLFVSEKLLLNSFAKFVKTLGKGRGKKRRIDRLITEFMSTEAASKLPLSEVRRLAKKYTQPDAGTFERFRKQFLLSDHPRNLNRFLVTFEDVMALVESNTE